MVGVKTNVVTSVAVTASNANDSPLLPGFVGSTAQRFTLAEVSADKAYLGEHNLATIAGAGAAPYIPFKVNSTDGGSEMWNRLYGFFMFHRKTFLDYYHKRSNVESSFNMVKAKFGDAVRSKSDDGQRNEVLLKILCHNICVLVQEMYELGIDPGFTQEQPSAQKVLYLHKKN